MVYIEACPINKSNGNSIVTVRRALVKIFHTTSQSIILDCQNYFNIPVITVSQQQRKCKFIKKVAASENSLCSIEQREIDSLDHL